MVRAGLTQHALIFQRRIVRTARPGRPAYTYRIPSPLEIEAEYAPGAGSSPHDALEPEDLQSVHHYRLGLHRMLIVRLFIQNGGEGVTMYRDLQAERLGVSTRTIRSYDKKLGFSHVPNYSKTLLSKESWRGLPRYKERFDKKTGKRLASRYWLESYDWKTGQTTRMPFVKCLAYKASQADLDVYRVERLANTYYPYARPNEAAFGGDYVLDFYYANREAYERAGFTRRDNQWQYTPPVRAQNKGVAFPLRE